MTNTAVLSCCLSDKSNSLIGTNDCHATVQKNYSLAENNAKNIRHFFFIK